MIEEFWTGGANEWDNHSSQGDCVDSVARTNFRRLEELVWEGMNSFVLSVLGMPDLGSGYVAGL